MHYLSHTISKMYYTKNVSFVCLFNLKFKFKWNFFLVLFAKSGNPTFVLDGLQICMEMRALALGSAIPAEFLLFLWRLPQLIQSKELPCLILLVYC